MDMETLARRLELYKRQRDRLFGVAMRIIRNCEKGSASRHQVADGKCSLAGCSMSLEDIEEARAACMLVTACDPFRQVKVGSLSPSHPKDQSGPELADLRALIESASKADD